MSGLGHCTITGCGKEHYAKGLCQAHYTRLRRHGSPTGGRTPPGEPLKWIQDRVAYGGVECFAWPFAKSRGNAGVVLFRGVQSVAARVMCAMAHGEPPSSGMDAAHSCGNGHLSCMNPNHLRWASRKENLDDMIVHGTRKFGEQNPRAILTEQDVIFIRANPDTPPKDLAARFGVGTATIYSVRKRKNWKWLD